MPVINNHYVPGPQHPVPQPHVEVQFHPDLAVVDEEENDFLQEMEEMAADDAAPPQQADPQLNVLKKAGKPLKKKAAPMGGGFPADDGSSLYYNGSAVKPISSSFRGLVVFYIGVGQATPVQAASMLDTMKELYKKVVTRLETAGYEIMWFPTRGDTKTDFFQVGY